MIDDCTGEDTKEENTEEWGFIDTELRNNVDLLYRQDRSTTPKLPAYELNPSAFLREDNKTPTGEGSMIHLPHPLSVPLGASV